MIKCNQKWLLMCFNGFDLSDRVLCSFHLVCYIANSFSDICFSTNTNSFINVTSWMDTSLSLKRVFDFPVTYFILMSYLSLVNLSNFSINCLEATSFLSQYRSSIKITGSLTSKKPGSMIKSIIL